MKFSEIKKGRLVDNNEKPSAVEAPARFKTDLERVTEERDALHRQRINLQLDLESLKADREALRAHLQGKLDASYRALRRYEDSGKFSALQAITVALELQVRQAEKVVRAADALGGVLGTRENPAQPHYTDALGELECALSDYKELYVGEEG